MKKLFVVIVSIFVLSLSGCAGMAKKSVEDMKEMSKSFDAVMTQFVDDWHYISGAIDGAYEGRTFEVPSGHIELKKEIDKIVGPEKKPNKVGKYGKGKIATLWASLVTAEIIRWLKEFKPDVLKLIPSALLVL